MVMPAMITLHRGVEYDKSGMVEKVGREFWLLLLLVEPKSNLDSWNSPSRYKSEFGAVHNSCWSPMGLSQRQEFFLI
jgi:hypothetical protein